MNHAIAAHPLLIGLLLSASLAAACGPAPCTDCPQVAGDYDLVVHATPAESSSCREIAWDDGQVLINLEQSGSLLRIGEITGTLFEDWSVEFEPFQDFTVEGDPGETQITGQFSTDLSSFQAGLEFEFTRDRDNCRAKAPSQLLPVR